MARTGLPSAASRPVAARSSGRWRPILRGRCPWGMRSRPGCSSRCGRGSGARLGRDAVTAVRVDRGRGEPGQAQLAEIDVAADRPGLLAGGVECHLHQVEVGRMVAVGVLRIETLAGLRVVQLDPDRPPRQRGLQAGAVGRERSDPGLADGTLRVVLGTQRQGGLVVDRDRDPAVHVEGVEDVDGILLVDPEVRVLGEIPGAAGVGHAFAIAGCARGVRHPDEALGLADLHLGDVAAGVREVVREPVSV